MKQIDENNYVRGVVKNLWEKFGLAVDDDCIYKLGMNMHVTTSGKPEAQLKAERFEVG